MIKQIGILAAKLKRLFGKRNPDFEFDHEMHEHLRLLTERYIHAGMTPGDADSAARRQFGNTTLLREERTKMQTIPSLESLWRDVQYGARQFRLNPLFTTIAVLSLALGIGANTAVFTLLDQLVLRLLPVHDPERLLMIWSTGPHFGGNAGARTASYPMCQDFQRNAKTFDFVFCRFETSSSITIDGGTERVNAELISGNYFQAFGVGPAVGRVFAPEADDRVYKGQPSVVLSYQYWMRRFARVFRERRGYGFGRHYPIAPWSSCVELHWGPNCQIYITPVAADEVCVALISSDSGLRLEQALEGFPELRKRLAAGTPVTSELGAVTASRKLHRVQTQRVALVGDASGSADAITGQGMCLAFEQALALAAAVRCGRLDAYQAEHGELMKRPQFMSSVLLALVRHKAFEKRALAGLACRPELFESLVAFHVGAAAFRDLWSWRLVDFGVGFLAA